MMNRIALPLLMLGLALAPVLCWAAYRPLNCQDGRGSRLRRFLFWFCWLILFPLGCGVAVLSFSVYQTMSGRVLGIYFNPFLFCVPMILFSLVGWATYEHFKKRTKAH
jgi:hypothetical protein